MQREIPAVGRVSKAERGNRFLKVRGHTGGIYVLMFDVTILSVDRNHAGLIGKFSTLPHIKRSCEGRHDDNSFSGQGLTVRQLDFMCSDLVNLGTDLRCNASLGEQFLKMRLRSRLPESQMAEIRLRCHEGD